MMDARMDMRDMSHGHDRPMADLTARILLSAFIRHRFAGHSLLEHRWYFHVSCLTYLSFGWIYSKTLPLVYNITIENEAYGDHAILTTSSLETYGFTTYRGVIAGFRDACALHKVMGCASLILGRQMIPYLDTNYGVKLPEHRLGGSRTRPRLPCFHTTVIIR